MKIFIHSYMLNKIKYFNVLMKKNQQDFYDNMNYQTK